MRDLFFKNLTSEDKKSKIIATSEVYEEQGYRNIIHRHFICVIKEATKLPQERTTPYLYVLKEHNTREQKERFFCRVKGSVYVMFKKRMYLVLFTHSLKIDLSPVLPIQF